MTVKKHFEDIDPLDRLDFTVNYSQWLGTDQITGSVWYVDGDNPSGGLIIETDTFTTGTTTAWLISGSYGQTSEFKNEIGTLGGRRKNVTLSFTVNSGDE